MKFNVIKKNLDVNSLQNGKGNEFHKGDIVTCKYHKEDTGELIGFEKETYYYEEFFTRHKLTGAYPKVPAGKKETIYAVIKPAPNRRASFPIDECKKVESPEEISKYKEEYNKEQKRVNEMESIYKKTMQNKLKKNNTMPRNYPMRIGRFKTYKNNNTRSANIKNSLNRLTRKRKALKNYFIAPVTKVKDYIKTLKGRSKLREKLSKMFSKYLTKKK